MKYTQVNNLQWGEFTREIIFDESLYMVNILVKHHNKETAGLMSILMDCLNCSNTHVSSNYSHDQEALSPLLPYKVWLAKRNSNRVAKSLKS